MKVELLSYTPDALNLLLRTKGTRLKHEEDPANWSEDKKQEHLAYMRDTIQSSWEMVDYIFRIHSVTRAFTHQLVRTRTGSYAQQAMRVIDAREHSIVKPPKIAAQADQNAAWDSAVDAMMEAYARLLDLGAAPQDARGLLPTNITTSIVAKFNLRTLSDMAEKRLCTRTQGEYQDVFREMRRLVLEVHPWAEQFINVYCVNRGHCQFPRYGEKECPVYVAVIPNADLNAQRKRILNAFNNIRYEASPVARAGKAM